MFLCPGNRSGAGDTIAHAIQSGVEYDPQLPFDPHAGRAPAHVMAPALSEAGHEVCAEVSVEFLSRYNGKRSPTISSLLRHKSFAWARLRAYERTPTREVESSFTSHTWQSSQ